MVAADNARHFAQAAFDIIARSQGLAAQDLVRRLGRRSDMVSIKTLSTYCVYMSATYLLKSGFMAAKSARVAARDDVQKRN
jgi:hypothetical protein